jgi:hypothetical protein
MLLLQETQDLFDTINPILAQQEKESPAFREHQLYKQQTSSSSSLQNSSSLLSSSSVAVVFGGKYSPSPRSISELLVSKLVATCPRGVITVSRTPLEKLLEDASISALPENVTHIAKQQLDDNDNGDGDGSGTKGGIYEFSKVLQVALDTFFESSSSSKPNNSTKDVSNTDELVLYFTLGQHKGKNPFVRNIEAAQNFAQALLAPENASLLNSSNTPSIQWKVVLTGTDATLPSTHPDGSIQGLNMGGGDATTTCTVPTYKIMKYNYTYAMSKLGQYYIIANAIAKLSSKNKLVEECAPILDKIQRHVRAAGEDGDYHEEDASMIISLEELDRISTHMMDSILPRLQARIQQNDDDTTADASCAGGYLNIAQGISICYTPLHARPWTEQAWNVTASSSSPTNSSSRDAQKAYVLEQIVKRFKNAISIEQAVANHLQC